MKKIVLINDTPKYKSEEEYIIKTEKKEDTIIIDLEIIKNCTLHICFKIDKENFLQKICLNLKINNNVKCKIEKQCLFDSVNATHVSNIELILEPNSTLNIIETNIGTKKSKLITSTKATLKKNSQLISTFKILNSNIDYAKVKSVFILYEDSKLNQTTIGEGRLNSEYSFEEKINLFGKNSSSIIKAKGVARENSKINLFLCAIGHGENTKAHIDCKEIILDQGNIETTPKLIAKTNKTRLTHEATIGNIEDNMIEILMSKGLTKDEAINFIINCFLT